MSKLALIGGNPIGAVNPPPYPRFTSKAIDRVKDLLERGATVGLNKTNPEIAEVESAISRWHDIPHCLSTASGHAALHAALIGLEITGGDEVITTPYTWGASTSCILHNNAVPVFADVDPNTGLIDPESIAACITRKTRAILAVHIFGQPANMTAIRTIADRHNLVVIEDGSQAHGALHAGRKVGCFGDAAGFSCMGGKLLASTEAGYLVTPREDVYWKAAMGGQHMGRSPESGFPDHLRPYADSLVYTQRLSPVNAVLLTEQLKKLDTELDARRKNVAHFKTALNGVQSLSFPAYPEGDEPAYHMLTLNFNAKHAGISRDTYFTALRAEGARLNGYVPSPIPQWPRLQPDHDGPRVMWTDTLKRSGIDYTKTHVPNCETKIEKSVEIGWNFVDEDPASMRKLASMFHKVEEGLDDLRNWEKSGSTEGRR